MNRTLTHDFDRLTITASNGDKVILDCNLVSNVGALTADDVPALWRLLVFAVQESLRVQAVTEQYQKRNGDI